MSKKTGTKEWADHSMNIQRGCEHNCRYCYARYNAVDRFKTCEARHWPLPCINEAKVDMPHKRKYDGGIMFPTTHDITSANLSQYLCVLRKLLDAGNDVLIVSKPHIECIDTICNFYAEYRDQIMFRFSIGSTSDDVLGFWKPNAPTFTERLTCLKLAFDRGFKTSVSCEPYLDAYAPHTYFTCRDFITDSFWVGKLRGFNSRVRLDDVTPAQMKKFVDMLKVILSDNIVKIIYRSLEGQPFIKWKDSIREVMGE